MRVLIVSLLAFSFLAGCTSGGDGSASIYVKDAPVDDFDEVHVVFSKVEIHRSSGNASWITLYENSTGRDIDLLNLTGAKAAFLGEHNLSAGKYQQIRIHALEAYGVRDGQRVELTFNPTPFKVTGSFEIVADKETRITLDLDLNNSIKEQGNGVYRFTPVIGKVFAEVVEDSESGADVHTEGETTELEELA